MSLRIGPSHSFGKLPPLTQLDRVSKKGHNRLNNKEYSKAERCFEKIEAVHALMNIRGIYRAHNLSALGITWIERGETGAAVYHCGRAEEIYAEVAVGDRDRAINLNYYGSALMEEEAYEGGIRAFEGAEEVYAFLEEISRDRISNLSDLRDALLEGEDYDKGKTRDVCLKIKETYETLNIIDQRRVDNLSHLGEVLIDAKKYARARNVLIEAVQIFEGKGVDLSLLRELLGVASRFVAAFSCRSDDQG